jgi:hypothetical protein
MGSCARGRLESLSQAIALLALPILSILNSFSDDPRGGGIRVDCDGPFGSRSGPGGWAFYDIIITQEETSIEKALSS